MASQVAETDLVASQPATSFVVKEVATNDFVAT
jgi:hypothetical protein